MTSKGIAVMIASQPKGQTGNVGLAMLAALERQQARQSRRTT